MATSTATVRSIQSTNCRHWKMKRWFRLEALVTAVTTSGCIVTDAQYAVNMFLQTATAVNVGDKVAVKGSKGTDAHALPYVVCDEVRVVSEAQ